MLLLNVLKTITEVKHNGFANVIVAKPKLYEQTTYEVEEQFHVVVCIIMGKTKRYR